MVSRSRDRIVVDNIHGDILLSPMEWAVVNTPSFQRLRYLKQLGMGHLTYPNATHTRFAHSLGVFKIMSRITGILANVGSTKFDEELRCDLRLAALLHDIGHYPYSHLMEMVERVTLTEDQLLPTGSDSATLEAVEKYPEHEQLGEFILLNQSDLLKAVGGEQRARRVAAIFQRTEAANPHLSKLIHSSLDMDRLDYLLRDSRMAGVPYGEIDLNYLLNNIRVSESGEVGVEWKALTAAEHFLLARMSMYRAVYYHKTTFALEEACRQLLKRVRDAGKFGIPVDGAEIRKLCGSNELNSFTDDFVDRIIRQAAEDDDIVIRTLARCITTRCPPKLVWEVSGMYLKANSHDRVSTFIQHCRYELKTIAEEFGLEVGQFLICGPKPIKFEDRGSHFSVDEARRLEMPEREELIKVFRPYENEPKSLVDIPETIINHCSNHVYKIQRLYLADLSDNAQKTIEEVRAKIRKWSLD